MNVDVEPRPLERAEAELLVWLLKNGNPGADQLIDQVPNLEVVGKCGCGCASIDFAIRGKPRTKSGGLHILSDYQWKDSSENMFGVFAFSKENEIAGIEVWSIDGNETPSQLPNPKQLVPIEFLTISKETENTHEFDNSEMVGRVAENFLLALGVNKVVFDKKGAKLLSGRVYFDDVTEEESQDFKFVPSGEIEFNTCLDTLISKIRELRLIDIDRISIGREMLVKLLHESGLPEFSPEESRRAVSDLFRIRIDMIDDGEETDYFFVHE